MLTRPTAFQIWAQAARPRTLPAAVAPVVVGTAFAADIGHLVWPAALACLGFALLIQVGTNFANDYYDFVKGADTAERVGPQRAVAAGWVTPATMKRVMLATFAAAFVVGLALLPFGGWPLLAIGVASILCGIAYTGGPYPLAYHGWGDVFVFLFFGLVAVGATFYVQAGWPPLGVWLAAVAVGALATNILLVNNYRDVETDAKAHKRTLLVRWGRGYGRAQFVVCHLLAVIVPFALVSTGWLQLAAAATVAVFASVMAFRHYRRLRSARSPGELIALLGATGKYLAGYGFALSAAILWT